MPFIEAAVGDELTNAMSTKQNVTRQIGIVVLASSETTLYYWHDFEPIP